MSDESLSESMRKWLDAWLPAMAVERWLVSELWDHSYPDIRIDWDDDDRWFWLIPFYEIGRTGVLGIQGEILRNESIDAVRQSLNAISWKERLREEHLLLRSTSQEPVTWAPTIADVWYPDPRGGFFVSYISSPRGLKPGELFLSLNGATWSAMGPKDPREPESYDLSDLEPYLPT